MDLLKRIAKSPITRWVFLAIALAGLLWVIVSNWEDLTAAVATLAWWVPVAAIALAIVYVFFTMWAWRALLADLGSPLGWSGSIQLFGMSQIGKYIPGGVWNIVAAAEIGHDYDIPADRSVTATTLAVLISLLTGAGIGVITVLSTSTVIQVPTWMIVVLLAALCIILAPPVLNRIISVVFKILKRPAPEKKMTFPGLMKATLLTAIAWIIAGMQIWVLAIGFGMVISLSGVLLSIGSYALAWVAGYLVVFVPAGTGVRESVLGLFFSGLLSSGGVLATVLVSRIAMTIADLAFAGVGALLSARRKKELVH